MIDKEKDILPIGTVVLLKNATKRIMVTGYMPITDDNKYFDYMGCIFPEGYISSTTNALFNKEDIDNIYMFGLVDPESMDFMKIVKDQCETLKNDNNFVKGSISESTNDETDDFEKDF